MRTKARLAVRTFSTGSMCPSLRARIGLIASAEPSKADADPIRPPRRRYSSVSTQNTRKDFVARDRATAAHVSPLAPAAAASAADSTAYPMAMPRVRESTTWTGTDACWAASRAPVTVPDISADRWTDTISSAPSATACS